MRRIVLLRHAEALKNVENRHGGTGTGLTELGRQQARNFATLATRYFGDLEGVYYVARPQCSETASVISEMAHVACFPIEHLLPFNLGALDGLSDQEAKLRFPIYAQMIEDWRLGLVDISDVRIPGMTNMEDFFEAGRLALNRIFSQTETSLIVGTRSILVMMWNALRGNAPIPGGGYFERPWSNCEWVEFLSTDGLAFREARNQRHRA